MTEQKKISLRVLDGQTEFAEDELQRMGDFFNKISKPLFYLLLIGAVGFFGFRFYSDAKVKSTKEGAAQFEVVKSTYAELLKAIEDKTKPEAVTSVAAKLSEQIKTLSDKPKPYHDFARLYSLLSAKATGDSAAVSSLLNDPASQIVFDNFKQSFANELYTVTAARFMMDDAGMAAKGKDLLSKIAEAKGYFSEAAIAKIAGK